MVELLSEKVEARLGLAANAALGGDIDQAYTHIADANKVLSLQSSDRQCGADYVHAHSATRRTRGLIDLQKGVQMSEAPSEQYRLLVQADGHFDAALYQPGRVINTLMPSSATGSMSPDQARALSFADCGMVQLNKALRHVSCLAVGQTAALGRNHDQFVGDSIANAGVYMQAGAQPWQHLLRSVLTDFTNGEVLGYPLRQSELPTAESRLFGDIMWRLSNMAVEF